MVPSSRGWSGNNVLAGKQAGAKEAVLGTDKSNFNRAMSGPVGMPL